MAVFKPDLLNLAPSYANIERTLERKADIASKDTGDIGYVQAIAQPIAAEAGKLGDMWIQKNMTDYKARLENEIKRMESEREFANSGGILITPKNKADLELNMGVPPGTIPESLVGQRLKDTTQLTDLFVKPHKDKEFELKVQKLKEEHPDQASLLDVYLSDTGKSAGSLKEVSDLLNPDTFGKMMPVKDPSSSTGWRYATLKKDGTTAMTLLEAPDPTKRVGGSSPSLSPVKREEALRKEFTARSKDSGFIQKRDAFTGAINSLENPSVSNDISLIYSVAKARDGSGRLSDQDVEQAAKAGNLPGDLQKRFNFLVSTKKLLSDDVRQSLVASVVQPYQQAERNLLSLEDEYKGLAAQEEGVKPENAIINLRPKSDSVDAIALLVEKNKAITPESIAIAKKIIKKKKQNEAQNR